MLLECLQQANNFSPILPKEFQLTNSITFDLSTIESPFYGVTDLEQLNAITQQLLQDASVNLGIGAYAEKRFSYEQHHQFAGRNIHLGLDLTVPVYTSIMTPLAAEVHSVANHQQEGDYGPTVILRHNMGAKTFYSLYGHLHSKSLKNLEVGQFLLPGTCFAMVGGSHENGHWPPHLHFQLVEKLGDYTDTYPGVCSEAEQEFYLANCPDPSILFK